MRALRLTVLGLLLGVTAALAAFRLSAWWRERVDDATMRPADGRTIETAAGPLFVQETGPATGPSVLLVHGTAAWGEIWRPTLTALSAAGYHALAVDLPPFGFSPRPAGATYGTADQARRLTALVAALQLRDVVLIGHSMGARPTMAAAWQLAEQLEALVLVDAALDPLPTDSLPAPGGASLTDVLGVPLLGEAIVAATVTNPLLSRRLLEQLIADPAAATPDRLAMLQRPMVRRETTAGVTSWLRQAFGDVPETGLADRRRYAAFDRPVLLIWGAEDAITSLAQGRRLKSAFPRASEAVLSGVGHIPHLESLDRFNQALLGWLRELRAGPSSRPGPASP